VKPRSFQELLSILGEEFGIELASRLARGESVEGVLAWRILEYLKKWGRVVYEDEEVDERECYIVVVAVSGLAVYALVKSGGVTRAYLAGIEGKNSVVEKALSIYRECVE